MFRVITKADIPHFLRDEDIPILCRTKERLIQFVSIAKECGVKISYNVELLEGNTCIYSDGCHSSLNYALENYSNKILEFDGFKDNADTVTTLRKLRGKTNG